MSQYTKEIKHKKGEKEKRGCDLRAQVSGSDLKWVRYACKSTCSIQQAWAKCIRIHKYLNTFLKVFVFEYFSEKCKVFVFKYISKVFVFMNTFMNTFNIFRFLLIFFTLY